jgi:hypothetical protein
MNNAVNLLMVVQNLHAEDRPATLGLHEPKAKVIDRVAVPQALIGPCQIGLG